MRGGTEWQGQTIERRDRENQSDSPGLELAKLIWTRSAHLHAGPRPSAPHLRGLTHDRTDLMPRPITALAHQGDPHVESSRGCRAGGTTGALPRPGWPSGRPGSCGCRGCPSPRRRPERASGRGRVRCRCGRCRRSLVCRRPRGRRSGHGGAAGSVRNSVYSPPVRFQSDRPQPPSGEKRSSNVMANWFTAVSHPLTVLEVFSCPRIAR